jgi:hypothetical protein
MLGVYLLHNEGRLVEKYEQERKPEALMEELSVEYPSLIAGDKTDPHALRRWVLVPWERGAPGISGFSGCSFDAYLFLDQEGIPALVGIKRSADKRLFRDVIADVLNCAEHVVAEWPAEAIRARFEAASPDPDAQLARLLGERSDLEHFWHCVSTCLGAGKMRLIFIGSDSH